VTTYVGKPSATRSGN